MVIYEINVCPNCQERVGDARPFTGVDNLQLSITAETLVAQLPPYPAAHNTYLPARGRRVLAFSDSRQEAARLGPLLTCQHELQMARSTIMKLVHREAISDDRVILRYKKRLANLEEELKSDDLTEAERNDIEEERLQLLQRLSAALAGGSVSAWGKKYAQEEVIGQFMHAESAVGHIPGKPYEFWLDNRQNMVGEVQNFLIQELASPPRRNISLETLGLVEVTYPGIETLVADDALLGLLPLEETREALRSNWADLVIFLLDLLRGEGVITWERKETRNKRYGRAIYSNKICVESNASGAWMVSFVGRQPKDWQQLSGENYRKRISRRNRFVLEVITCRKSQAAGPVPPGYA